MARSSPEVQEK